MELIKIFIGIIAVVQICMFVSSLIDSCLVVHHRRKEIKIIDHSVELQNQIVNLQKQNVQQNEDGRKTLENYTYMFTTLELRIKALEKILPKENN